MPLRASLNLNNSKTVYLYNIYISVWYVYICTYVYYISVMEQSDVLSILHY